MDLIVVESPTKARTLSRFLGSDFVVEATMGHIKDLPKEKIGVDVENNFEPQYLVVAKKDKSVAAIKKAAKKAKTVYLASDPDREGEAIAQHVKEIIGTGLVKRIVFHEITKDAVIEAIKNPRVIDTNLVNAQVGRRVLDRLVGYKLSPLLWKKVRRGLSAGRVQTVTVRLIVEKEREINAFVSEEFWEILVNVKKLEGSGSEPFSVRLLKINGKTAKITHGDYASKVVSELEKSKYQVSDVRRKEVRKVPYPPFTTSTLTQAGSRLFGWSAKRTMQIAQKLYEEGLITYHRTDSTNIATVAVEKVRGYISKNFGQDYLPGAVRIYKTKSKLAQEAHEAIRPTDVEKKLPKEEGGPESKLYDLIWRRFVSCQMADSIYDETVIDVVTLSTNVYLLRAGGQVMKFAGWRKVTLLSRDEVSVLPEVSKDENLDLVGVLSDQKFTQPPTRYTEASLIKTLESLGIGRPSTYAPTITTIQVRNYVEKTDAKFFPTSIGTAVNDFLISNFSEIFDYSFTAEMEAKLDGVASGDVDWRGMMKNFYKPFIKKIEKVEKKGARVKIATESLGKKCADCKDGELVVRIGRFGKFISCSNFPECKHTERFVEKLDMKCPDCGQGDVIVKTTKRGKKFFGCSLYPDCKWASWKKPN